MNSITDFKKSLISADNEKLTDITNEEIKMIDYSAPTSRSHPNTRSDKIAIIRENDKIRDMIENGLLNIITVNKLI